jgi:hypothetical protein
VWAAEYGGHPAIRVLSHRHGLSLTFFTVNIIRPASRGRGDAVRRGMSKLLVVSGSEMRGLPVDELLSRPTWMIGTPS